MNESQITNDNELDRLRLLLTERDKTISQQEADLADKDRIINSTNRLGLAYSTVPEEGDAQRLLAGQVPALVPDDEHSTVKNTTETDHVLIEGDNLTTLAILQETHKGKVNVIYIDPPYNTGHQDFVYNDRFVDSEDGYKHSKWLSFMKPRLVLARNLLADDGVIFVSIDDHEQAYLKILMDEIFGENNFVNDFIWVSNLKGRQLSNGGAVKTYEHILCYKKRNLNEFTITLKKAMDLMPIIYRNKNYDVNHDAIGDYVIKNELYNTNSKFNEQSSSSLVFNIWYDKKNNTVRFSDVDDDQVFDGYVLIKPHHNNDGVHKYHAWRWSKNKIIKDIEDLAFIQSEDTYKVYTKIREFSNTSLKDIVLGISTGNIDSIIGKHRFNFPKPPSLLKLLLQSTTSSDSVILDFFAGSGTTGQAVAELNAEDGGNRQAILCTNNFEQDGSANGIARDITAVRMRRVLTGNDWADGKDHEPLPGNLRYYRVEFRNNLVQTEDAFLSIPADDMIAVIGLRENTLQYADSNDIPTAYTALGSVIADDHAVLLTNGDDDYTLVYKDWAEVMGEDDASLDLDDDEPTRFDLVRAEYDRLTNGSGKLYIATFDEHDDNGVVYPIPYIQHVHKTIQGLEHQGMLSRSK